MVLTFESVDKIEATEQCHFPVVLFIMVYIVVLSFESVDEMI